MSKTTSFLFGKRNSHVSKCLTISFPSSGMKLFRLLSTRIPLFIPEDELGSTTSDDNVYSGLPTKGQTFDHKIYLLTNKFINLDVESTINVHLVKEEHILSFTHVRPFDIPCLLGQTDVRSVSTQTEMSLEPFMNEFTNPITIPANEADSSQFELLTLPIVIPVITMATTLAYNVRAGNLSTQQLWELIKSESALSLRNSDHVETLKMYPTYSGQYCNGTIIGIHRNSELRLIISDESHPCTNGYCLINWALTIIAYGHGSDDYLITCFSFIIKLLHDEFHLSSKFNYKDFLSACGSLFIFTEIRNILTDYIENPFTKVHSDHELYKMLRDKYFNNSWLKVFYTQTTYLNTEYISQNRLNQQQTTINQRNRRRIRQHVI